MDQTDRYSRGLRAKPGRKNYHQIDTIVDLKWGSDRVSTLNLSILILLKGSDGDPVGIQPVMSVTFTYSLVSLVGLALVRGSKRIMRMTVNDYEQQREGCTPVDWASTPTPM